MSSVEEKLVKINDRIDNLELKQQVISELKAELKQFIHSELLNISEKITKEIRTTIKSYDDMASKVAVLNDINNRLQEVENYRNPNSINGRVENCLSQIDDLIGNVSSLHAKFQSFVKDGKFAEIFTDDEIKELYINSGLSTNDVKRYIEINFNNGNDISVATVSNYINGSIKDILVRSALGRYFRYECVKNSSKVKQ